MVSTLKAFPFSLLHPTWAVGEAELLESILECVGAGKGCSCFCGKAMGNGSSKCGCSVQAGIGFLVWILSTPTFPIPPIPAGSPLPVLARDAGIADEHLLAQ